MVLPLTRTYRGRREMDPEHNKTPFCTQGNSVCRGERSVVVLVYLNHTLMIFSL
jgi:hypothetical protein